MLWNRRLLEAKNPMKILRVLLLTVAFSTVCRAGQILGTVKEGQKAVPAGTRVTINCGTAVSFEGQTDVYGFYSINVRRTGACTLTVTLDSCASSFQIYSENDPIRYDFAIERPGGTCALRRK